MENLFADILATVVENGRLECGDNEGWEEEIELEIEWEGTERGLTEAEVADAVEWALSHYRP